MKHKIFTTKEAYLAFLTAWKQAAQTKTLDVEHFILYNILRGRPASTGFTPLTDRKVISRNGDKWNGYNSALRRIQYVDYYKSAPFDKFITFDQYSEIRRQIAAGVHKVEE